MFGKIGYLELAIIIFIVLIIFGPGKLPQVAKAIGESIKSYREEIRGKNDTVGKEKDEDS